MRSDYRTIALALLSVLGAPFLAACNTIEGIGQDVEALGEEIEEEADDARN
jgi:predicted small secreted protein